MAGSVARLFISSNYKPSPLTLLFANLAAVRKESKHLNNSALLSYLNIQRQMSQVVVSGSGTEVAEDTKPKSEETTTEQHETTPKPVDSGSVVNGSNERKIKKRKLVLLLSYCGQNYYGMQKNPGPVTIEEVLFDSLLKAGYMTEEATVKPQVAQFQRAARTDKHVSAARQIVSFKADEFLSVDSINEHLPPEVRVMGVKRVTQGFDAKNNCDSRTYMYMTPTFAFAPMEVKSTEAYRIPSERLKELQSFLDLYLGVKNFHNFTSRKRPHDPSAMRKIYSFTCGQPFVKDDMEYILLRVRGQSFMMHQIRKMIGLVMACMRGFATVETFEKCWTTNRIDIPKAPGVGLMLDYVHYERYDKKFGADGMHDPITWDHVENEIQNFCDEYIYPVVTHAEKVEKSMLTWLATLPYHTYDVREEERGEPEPVSSNLSQIGKAYLHACQMQGTSPFISSDDIEKAKLHNKDKANSEKRDNPVETGDEDKDDAETSSKRVRLEM